MREFNEFIGYVCELIKLKLQFNIVLDAFWLNPENLSDKIQLAFEEVFIEECAKLNIHVQNVKLINTDYYNYIYKLILEYFYYSSISNEIKIKDRTEIVKKKIIFFANNIVINNLIYNSNNLNICAPSSRNKSYQMLLPQIVSDEEKNEKEKEEESLNVNNDDEAKIEENNYDDEFSSIDINDLITFHKSI